MLLIILLIFIIFSLVGIFGVVIYACATTTGLQMLCIRIFCGKASLANRRRPLPNHIIFDEPYSIYKRPESVSSFSKPYYQTYRPPVPKEIQSLEYEEEPRVRNVKNFQPHPGYSSASPGIYVIPLSPQPSHQHDYDYSWSNDPAPGYHQPYLRGIIV